MASPTYSVPASPAEQTSTEHSTLRSVQLTLKYLLTLVPIAAGADKFTNLLAHWETYLNPLVLNIVPVTAGTFMRLVGVIEILAGVLVFVRPRIGAWVVMAWLIAIAGQLLIWGQFLDIAVRDCVIALGSAWTLARLSAPAQRPRTE